MTNLPFSDGSPADFAAVRELLIAAGYTEDAVCRRGGTPSIHEMSTVGEGRKTGLEYDDALGALIRLLFDGLPVPRSTLEAVLPLPGPKALERLRLIVPYRGDAETLAATVRLYPTEGLYIISDLDPEAPGAADLDELEPPDHVFSAITSLTGSYLKQLPDTPCERFLELCGGTGIAALVASRFAGHAWTADITARSTAFAAFNAQLNGLSNVSAVQGDLYEPVRGMTFDRIVAHPPYVPAPRTSMIYRDGGSDGEAIIRRILAELPDYLDPGGRFYLTALATDRQDAPLEQRVRSMLGDREGEFDLLLVAQYAMSPGEYYGRAASSGRITYAVAEERTTLFRELKAERVVYASLVLQRHSRPGERQAITLRRDGTQRSTGRESTWLLDWTVRMAGQSVAVLLDARPRLLSNPRLHVTHRVEGGEWKVDECKLVVEYPYQQSVDLSLNAAMLLTLCDGEHTVREILDRIQQAGAISRDVPPEAFAEFVRELVNAGVLGVGGEPENHATPPEQEPPPTVAN